MNFIITGASSGIGKELTLKCIELGYNVLAISRNRLKLSNLLNEAKLINNNAKLYVLPEDINNIEKRKISEIINQSFNNKIDVLINNAGVLINKPFINFSENEICEIFNTNFFGPAKLIKNVYEFMNNAHIVNISSMGGFQGSDKFNGLSYYSASKAALACLSECLALEFKIKNISVNALALGAVQTEMLAEAFKNYKAPIDAKEMANYVIDFAIKGNKYFNGKIIPVALSTP